MSISAFILAIQESNYNLLEIYNKAPNETLIALGLILLFVLIVYFFINKEIKTKQAISTINKLQDCKTYDEFNTKLAKIIKELPRRGVKVADILNTCKDNILARTSKLLEGLSIEEKISKYQELSSNFDLLSKGSKKYSNDDLTNFYEQKSKELLEQDLAKEISNYIKNTYFNENEINNVNAIVKYANSKEELNPILDEMIKTLDDFSYSHNVEFFKFIELLDDENSKQIFKHCTEKINQIFTSGEKELSSYIFDYVYEKDKEKIYTYIKSIKIDYFLQYLYHVYFNKKDDLELDLSFIANETKIDHDYKNYIDVSLTNNWNDKKHVDYVSKAKGVLEVLGHVEFRNLIARIDTINIQEENTKKVNEALEIAKRAEKIALEAKSLSKKPIVLPSTPKA